MWKIIWTTYIGAKFGGTNRNAQLSWRTLCNEIMKSFACSNLPSASSPLNPLQINTCNL